MKYIILLLSLFALSLCTTRKETPGIVADIYKGIKTKIYKCVSETSGISAQLKELSEKNLNSDENLPLAFHTIDLTKDDRLAIKNCKRQVFIKENTK